MALEKNPVVLSVDADVEPEVRQESAAVQSLDANESVSKAVKSRSDLDCVKAKAPWRRRYVGLASPTEVTASNMSVIDGESAVTSAEMEPIFRGARIAAEGRDGSEATSEVSSKVQKVGSTHQCFLKNTFIDIVQDNVGADVGTEPFDVQPLIRRVNSDNCIDYRCGTAPASTSGFEQAAGNIEYGASWTPVFTEGFTTAYENAENNEDVSVYCQPVWFYMADMSATAGEEEVYGEQTAPTTLQQFVGCTEDFSCMYPLACHVVACDFSGANAEQTCYGAEKNQWNYSREARDRSVSMAASSDSTVASANDVQTRNNSQANIILRNIPNRFTRDMLVNLLDKEGFRTCYEFVYLPCDFQSGFSLGYAFVVMLTREDAKRAIAHFQGYHDWKLATSKVCETGWGKDCADLHWHLERYRNSSVMHPSVAEMFRPAFFRDGVQVPFPPPTRKIEAPWAQ